ncbi:hypothetical protein EV426DRAFT_706456 [Tirmania nivea]|nr:hypothetical protein EV426DRAFT_706456 [Tirmania nivea]
MPRTSEKTQVLQDINTELESIAYAYAYASSSEEEDEYEEDIEDLVTIQDVIVSDRYLLSRDSAGQHVVCGYAGMRVFVRWMWNCRQPSLFPVTLTVGFCTITSTARTVKPVDATRTVGQ